MSDFQAIGGVTRTLQTLLLDRMELPGNINPVPVTVGPPMFSSKDGDPHAEESRVNVFLYRVTENGYLQNQEIAGRGSASGYGHPPLSLNLHYLVTGYGNAEVHGSTFFDETMSQFLLGSAMRVLHDVPIITDNMTTVRAPSGRSVLDASLRGEFEHVKLSLEPLSLEDITKIWTSLALRYRLSAPYVVNVVQIESRRPRRFPRPVGQPASAIIPPFPGDATAIGPVLSVLAIQTPTIVDVKVRRIGETTEQPFPYARIGDTLVLRGTNLVGPVTTVAFGELRVPAAFAAGDRVEAVIPDATVPGLGAIPPEQVLQPGVRTVKVIVSDPRIPQSSFGSNEAVFMLVPTANPALVAYVPGSPRKVTIGGARLLGPGQGGETVIGRSVVPRADYLSATPTQLDVPVPDSLPARDVQVIVSDPLTPTVTLDAGAQTLSIAIGGGAPKTVTANLVSPVDRDALPAILAALIHDATPIDPDNRAFLRARVDLWGDRLVVVPGGLFGPISITSLAGLTFAGKLGLAAAPLPGVNSAAISGELTSPPPISSATPRLQIKIGIQPAVVVGFAKPTSLASLATALQSAINAAGAATEYANARVGVSGAQLLIIPGAAGTVTFSAAPGDTTTVAELQLHAQFALRVRVNGAESIDPALLELPQ